MLLPQSLLGNIYRWFPSRSGSLRSTFTAQVSWSRFLWHCSLAVLSFPQGWQRRAAAFGPPATNKRRFCPRRRNDTAKPPRCQCCPGLPGSFPPRGATRPAAGRSNRGRRGGEGEGESALGRIGNSAAAEENSLFHMERVLASKVVITED